MKALLLEAVSGTALFAAGCGSGLCHVEVDAISRNPRPRRTYYLVPAMWDAMKSSSSGGAYSIACCRTQGSPWPTRTSGVAVFVATAWGSADELLHVHHADRQLTGRHEDLADHGPDGNSHVTGGHRCRR